MRVKKDTLPTYHEVQREGSARKQDESFSGHQSSLWVLQGSLTVPVCADSINLNPTE